MQSIDGLNSNQNMNLNRGKSNDRFTLAAIARRAMIERGLEPDFPPLALQELAAISRPAESSGDVRDLRDRLWASIDNDDSRDLDQLTVAESLTGGRVRILVARRSIATHRATRPPSILRPPSFPCYPRDCRPILRR